ncbi:MAG TPA: PAS-domain containing protein, partial [Thermohalobaculum sp.]|nr:PAS-domain containing protein [Thermohalobaculum sp.]
MGNPDSHVLDGLEELDVGIGIFDAEACLVHCNRSFRILRRYPKKLCKPGTPLEAMLRFNAERGDFGPGDIEAQVADRLAEIVGAGEREVEREMADGQILRIRYRRTAAGGQVISFVDCTAERRAEAALKVSEERYALVSEAAEEAIYEWDIANERFFASPRLRAWLGREMRDDGIRSWNWDEIIHADDIGHYRAMLDRHLSGEEPLWSCEYRLKDADGAWRWVSDHGTSVRDADGKAIRMVAALRDITERFEKDAALAASEERHALVTRATADGIYDWNVAEDKLYVSDNLKRILDFDFDLRASGMWAERVHSDDYDTYVSAIRKHFRGETDALECEYRVRGASGGYRWIQDRGIGVRDKDGRVIRMVGAVRDISDMKQARAEIERTETRLTSALATISDGLLLVDAENRVQLWNERYHEIFTEAAGGADLSKVIVKDRPFFDMIRDGYNLGMFKPHPDGVDAWVKARIKAWDKPVSEWELELANGNWILLNERQMPDGGRVSVYTEITELKRRETEAQAARERFEEAIEAISSGFALFDAKDHLVLWNSRFREYFSEVEDVFTPGVPFRDMLAATIKRGLFPGAKEDPEGFLDALLAKRAKGVGQIRENVLSDGLWLQIRDHRTKDGGMVSIYTDVTELKTSEQEARAARERFEEAIEAISSGFTLWDAEDRLIICNSRYREYYEDLADIVQPGARFKDILLQGAERGLLPEATDDPVAYVEANAKKRQEGVGKLREHRLTSGRWLQVTDHRTADGGIVSIHTDVTELKNREAEIRRQSAILEATMENMGQGITMVDKDLQTVAFNKKFFELMEFPEDRFGRGFSMEDAFRYNAERGEYGPGDVEQQVAERLALAGKFLPHKFERTRPDGTVLEIVGNPIEGGGLVATYTDITERKRADEALKAALAEIKVVLDNIDYGVILMGPDLRARIVNDAQKRIWGFTDELIDSRPGMRELIEFNRYTGRYDVADEDWDAWIEQRIEQVQQGEIPPTELHRADGMVLSYQCVAMPDGGRMLTYFDITELKRAETVARDSETRLRGILENSPIGVAVIRESDNVILFHNARFPEVLRGPGENLVGVESSRFWTDLEERARAREVFERDGRVVNREVRYRGMDGSDIWSLSTYERADWEGEPARLIWLFDITEEKANREALVVARDEARAALADLQKAQARLVQAEKMASLGQLTAGIAHEIKNPLNFVNNFAKLSDELLEELADILEAPIQALDDEARDDAEDLLATVRENLGKINQHGRRADSIVKNMLLHSREGPAEQQTAALNPIAEEALNLAYHGARAENPKFNIEMKKVLGEDVGEIECFPQDVMRVLLNLITNGMYAANKRLAEQGGGEP